MLSCSYLTNLVNISVKYDVTVYFDMSGYC